MYDFSIIIPNWNGQHFLQACFDSIAAQKTKATIETILVDNNSSDTSLEYTKEHYPWVKVVSLDHNTGFARGVNEGIKVAQGKLISLLNNDTELDAHWVAEMIKASEEHAEASFFASKMLDFYDRSILDSCGDAMTWSGRSYKIGELEKDGPPFNKNRYVFGACGGASVYRKEFFDQVGLLDEVFFAYLEDVDLDFRAQLIGLKCLFVADARVYHIGSATSGKKSGFGFKMMVKNHFHLIYKNYSLRHLTRHFPKLLYAELRLIAAAFRYGFAGEYWKGLTQALKEHPKIRPQRAAIQKSRTVSDEYLNTVIEEHFTYKPLLKALRNAQ